MEANTQPIMIDKSTLRESMKLAGVTMHEVADRVGCSYHCVRLTMTYGNENMDVIRAGMELVREANERERAHRALLNDEIRQLHADTHSLYAEGTQATDRQ